VRPSYVAALAGSFVLALLQADDPRARRRERQFDFVVGLAQAEFTLPPGGKRPVLLGDAPIDTDDDTLEALVSVGTELRFGVVPIHPGAHLRWAVAPSKLHPHEPDPPARCSIAFEKQDGSRVLLEELEVGVATKPTRPRSGDLDLSMLKGERGTLVCATAGGDARQFVAWTQLQLVSEGRPEERRDREVPCESVAVDLAALAGGEGAQVGAIPLAVPGAFQAKVRVPQRALLRFFLGIPGETLHEGERPELGLKVRVSADDRVLVEQARLRRSVASDAFRAFEDVDLASCAGSEIALKIELVPRGSQPPERALLGLPRILTREQSARAERKPETPDLFLIVIDTLRADALGCYGSRRPTSPRLDDFARGGLVFDRAWSQASWTLPSTASILTGLDPDAHGVTGPESAWLHDDVETLAEALAQRGVTCGAFVANSLVSEANHFDQGFETFDGLNWANTRKVVDRTLAWLDDHERDRVFAYVHVIDPHAPYGAPLPPSETFDVPGNRFAGRNFDELMQSFGGAEGERSHVDLAEAVVRGRALYDTEVRYVDRWLGRLFDGLKARGRFDHAVILVTADHGEEFLDHGELFHGHHLYEESVRVPFLLRAPGLTPGRATTPMDGLHVKPLLLDLVDSVDPTAADAKARGHSPSSIHMVTERAREGGDTASRREAIVRWPWKLIVTPGSDHEELYDLSRDPAEKTDRHDGEPRALQAMRELLRRQREARAATQGPRWNPGSDELTERMRELGYVR
jgi:arylsulfatase